MSEHDTAVDPGRKSAGTMLREARQARGVHIAALAVAIKGNITFQNFSKNQPIILLLSHNNTGTLFMSNN
jgi:hypothetical protein